MRITRREALIGAGAAATAGLLLPRPAFALSSPYNFTTMAASSQTKIFGGNIVQVPPTFVSAPNDAYQYDWMFQHWTSSNVRDDWVKPQILNYKQRGRLDIRMQGGTRGVLAGTYTQGFYESCLTDLVTFIRAQGMTLALCGFAAGTWAAAGSPSAAAVWAVMASAITNVLAANQDIISYIEPGMQESTGGDIATNNTCCGLMKASGTTIPVLASITGGASDFSGYTPANVDLFGLHVYVNGGDPVTTGYNDIRDYWSRVLGTASAKPILIEEAGYGSAGTETMQQKADFFAHLLESCYGHPQCVGFIGWDGQGPGVFTGSTWNTLTINGTFNPDAFDPTKTWIDSAASTLIAAWGNPNRNLVFVQSLNGTQTIGTAPAILNVNQQTRGSSPITNAAYGTPFAVNTPVSVIGTATISGDAGTTYTVSLDLFDYVHSTYTNLASASRVGSGTLSLNLSGTITGNATPANASFAIYLRTSRGAGVDGSITALAITETIGVAPALNTPKATPLVL